MDNKPKVSVITIFFNNMPYLPEAIESVLAQTFADWELLLVDDGSSDESTQVAKRYAAEHPGKVFYLEHEGHQNRGMSPSRNRGLAHARGEFVALLDADDIWMPEKLAKQIALLDRHSDAGMLIHPALYWFSDGTKKPQDMHVPPGRLGPGAWVPWMMESDDNTACPSTIMIRKSLADRLGGFEESLGNQFEDQRMWYKTTLAATVYHDPQCVILYRVHQNSFSAGLGADIKAGAENKVLAARIRMLSWLTGYIEKQDPQRVVARGPAFRTLAQCSLCRHLLELARESATEGSWFSRLRTRWRVLSAHMAPLPFRFRSLLRFGAFFPDAASARLQALYASTRSSVS